MLVNRQLLLQDIKRAQVENRQIIENDILHDMEVVDRAHLYFDTSIIVGKASVDKIQHISQEIISTVKELHLQPNRQHWNILSVSIDGAIQQEPKKEEAKLFERADTALYTSKNNGK